MEKIFNWLLNVVKLTKILKEFRNASNDSSIVSFERFMKMFECPIIVRLPLDHKNSTF